MSRLKQWSMSYRQRAAELDLPQVGASGGAASEISISTQKATV
jgi:hypothetical protein